MLDLMVVEDYEALSQKGADMVASYIVRHPTAALLVATGNTPMGLYSKLAALRTQNGLDTSDLRVFQLDEYLGIGGEDDRSLYGWMAKSFLAPLGIADGQVVRLPGDADDPQSACRAYDEQVRAASSIDLAILGLGPNGHLGFNEPPADPTCTTRVVALSEESIESNSVYWGSRARVPREALTAGMDTILNAKATILVVSGRQKREVLRRTLQGPVTPQLPASYLQRAHLTVIADRDAWGEE